MKKSILLFLLTVSLSILTYGQTTTVTATPVYPDGNNFANGTVLAVFTPPTGTIDQNLYFINGAVFPYYVSGSINGSGTFTLVLTDDHRVMPQGGRWNFTVCSQASIACTNSLQDVFGTTINLTTLISNDVRAISASPFSLPRYFSDSEVATNGSLGGESYFDIATRVSRCWDGATWANCNSGGVGGGTVVSFGAGNFAPLFTTSVATSTTTPVLSFIASSVAAHTVYANETSGSAVPSFQTDAITINTTSPLAGGALTHLGDTITLSCPSCGLGTVTSIGETVPVGFAVNPATITSSGVFAITTSGLTTNKITKAVTNGLGDSSITDNGTNNPQSPNGLDISTAGGISMTVLNDTATGSTLNLSLCKSATAGQYKVCPTSTKTGVVGTATTGVGTAPGTSGSVSACFLGRCLWIADNTTVAGNYGIPSVTTAGRIHDTGSTTPTAATDNFLLLTSTTAGNTVEAEFATPDWFAANVLLAQYKKLRCETGLGDGLNAMAAGTYLQSFCYNDSGVTWTITGIRCLTDNNGTSTLNVTNGSGTGLLTGAVTCTNAWASGTQSGTITIANGDYTKFTFVADGTSKQTSWVVGMTQ